jgi:hypothetical protein
MELFQWRGECEHLLPGWSDADRVHLGEELADCLLYLVRLSDRCGIDLAAAALDKMQKNRRKYPAEAAFGRSDKYTAYQGEAREAEEREGGEGGKGAATPQPSAAASGRPAEWFTARSASPPPRAPPEASPRGPSPTDPRASLEAQFRAAAPQGAWREALLSAAPYAALVFGTACVAFSLGRRSGR